MTSAVAFFLLFVACTLAITGWAARRTASVDAFYTAGGHLPGWLNGIALAGDYLSAAAFLGAAGMYLGQGYDSLVYAVGTLAGWPLLLLLLAEKLRALGHYTVVDVLTRRFDDRRVRLVASAGSLTVTLSYLIVQMVGAGSLIELLFGLPYLASVTLVGLLMVLYVSLGGMLATTWVQMLKALLMLGCSLLLAGGVLRTFHYQPSALFEAVHALRGEAAFLPSKQLANPVEVLSLGVGITLGLLGLPHVLMRFFTVADDRAARQSVGWATALVALCFALNIVIGYGALAMLTPLAALHDASGKLLGGNNMAAIHLAAQLGGDTLKGLISAVAFASILAVVAGLVLAGASAISHDLYALCYPGQAASPQRQLTLSRRAVLALGAVAIALSVPFQHQNIAFLFGLAFAIAASCNFPVLLLALHWRGLSARGVLWGGLTGMVAALLLIITGPAVWVGILQQPRPLFPYANPALFSVPLAFIAAWLGSRRR